MSKASKLQYDGVPIHEVMKQSSKAVTNYSLVVVKQNGWLIERRKAHSAPWTASLFFPLSRSYSAMEFYFAEERRIEQTSSEYEGLRLVFFDGAHHHDIAGIVLAPKKPSEFQRRKGWRVSHVQIWRPLAALEVRT